MVLLVFIPLYLKFPLARVGGTFVSIRLEDLLIAITLGLWILYLILNKKIKVLFKDKFIQVVFTYFFIGGVSLISAIFLIKTASVNLGIFHYLRRYELMLLAPLMFTIVNSKRQSIIYLSVLSLIAFLVNLYALGQRFLSFPVITTSNSELSKGFIYRLGPSDRVSSTFAGHYDLAIFLMFMIIMIVTFIFYFRDNNTKINKDAIFLWLFLLLSMSIYVLIMTAARLSFVAAGVGLFTALILLGKKKYILLLAVIFVGLLIYPSKLRDRFISTFTINIQRSWSGYFSKYEEQNRRSQLNIPTLPTSGILIESEGVEAADIVPGEPIGLVDLAVYRSFEIRTQVEWPRALRSFIKNPLLGTGYSSLGLATDNDILRSLGEVGILGTLAFALVIVEMSKRVWRTYKETSGFYKYFSTGCLAIIVAFLVNSLFIDVFEASKAASIFWMLMGLNMGIKYNTKQHV